MCWVGALSWGHIYGRRVFLVADPMAWNSPGFYPGIQRAARTVLGVYLKRTCSRVTIASSALGFLNDCALYKSTHSHLCMSRLADCRRIQHTQHYSLGDSSDAAPRCEHCGDML